MTHAFKLEYLRNMLGNDDDTGEEVLSVYLELARQKILNRMYPYGTDEELESMKVPARYDMIQLNIACYLLNKRGAEGQIQHIENGIHRNYGSADVPDGMLEGVVPFAKAIR